MNMPFVPVYHDNRMYHEVARPGDASAHTHTHTHIHTHTHTHTHQVPLAQRLGIVFTARVHPVHPVDGRGGGRRGAAGAYARPRIDCACVLLALAPDHTNR